MSCLCDLVRQKDALDRVSQDSLDFAISVFGSSSCIPTFAPASLNRSDRGVGELVSDTLNNDGTLRHVQHVAKRISVYSRSCRWSGPRVLFAWTFSAG